MRYKRFEWIIDYSVYVEEIDEQHRQFLNIANNIFDLLESRNMPIDKLLAGISEFGNYAFYHFSTEEEYFKKFNYEDAEEHIKEHNLFREKANLFMEESKKDKADLKRIASEMAGFSGGWLIGHILSTDKNYISCFQINGLR